MNIRNGTKLCGCDYENIDGARVQGRKSSKEQDKASSKIDIVNHWAVCLPGVTTGDQADKYRTGNHARHTPPILHAQENSLLL